VFWTKIPDQESPEPKSDAEKSVCKFERRDGERFLLRTDYGSIIAEYSKEKGKLVGKIKAS